MVCFNCGREMKEGERWVFVLRWPMRNLGPGVDESTGEAETTLQICNDCASLGASHRLPMNYRPFDILKVEIDGFYWYVRRQAGKTIAPWPFDAAKNETQYGCSLCGHSALHFLYHNVIEIHEDKLGREGQLCLVDGTRVDLAMLCADCLP